MCAAPRSKLEAPAGGWPLARAAGAFSVSLPEPTRAAFATWLDLLVTWNRQLDLTAARDAGELVDLMVADALVLASRVPRGARVVDVGTGAGAPGLALAILRPDLSVTLAEPLAKRGAFLRTVIGTLNRADVVLHTGTGESLAASHPARFDVAMARATLPPEPWLALASLLVSPVGSAWVFLAREAPPAHPALEEAEAVDYAWPLTGAARRLLRYARPGAASGGAG